MTKSTQEAVAPRYGRVVPDIIGRREVTAEQAARNRRTGRGPKTPHKAIAPILSVSAATFWRYVAAKRLTPIKLSPGVTVFDLNEIHEFVNARRGA